MRRIGSVLALAGLVLICCGGALLADDAAATSQPSVVIESEKLLEALRAPLALLSNGAKQKRLPSDASRSVFASQVAVRDLAAEPAKTGRQILDTNAVRREWPVSATKSTAGKADVKLWESLFDRVASFSHFRFHNVRGSYVGGDRDVFVTFTGFAGLASLKSGSLGHIKGSANVHWKRTDRGWVITSFETVRFELTTVDSPMFEDVLTTAVAKGPRKQLQTSQRDLGLTAWITAIRAGGATFDAQVPAIAKAYREGVAPISLGQISVVDIDNDGLDDFYVVGSGEEALFFRNKGDGTFEEIGARLGLDLAGVSGAVFADFDNDGDKDAFVSYLQKGTRYLIQDSGKFTEARDRVEGSMPSWAVAMSVIDYDNDGLLDIYFGAWAGEHIAWIASPKERAQREGKPVDMSFPGLPEREAKELVTRLLDESADPVLARPGPPNVLLKNVGGGRFRRPEGAKATAIYLNTLAATWGDFDRDGDMDLYVVNEAGPNQLLRNDDGIFVDVSSAVTGEVGFGMGASIGDYDNDGRPDFYVTNMYSKAGLRIAGQLRASEKVAASARGNSLLRNRGDGFERIGSSPTSSADFGWGGAFADFNNDGRLDIYAPAGYVTIPEEVATVGDT